MKTRSIIMPAHEVRATLDGRKTQLRRPVRNVPADATRTALLAMNPPLHGCALLMHWMDGDRPLAPIKAEYGMPGDRLRVRETYAYRGDASSTVFSDLVLYAADFQDRWRGNLHFDGTWRSPVTMPMWASKADMIPASRLTLDITAVRIERLQDIGEADARAEGFDGDCPVGYVPAWQKGPCRYHFAWQWDQTYGDEGPNSYLQNPWVWVVEYQAVTP